MINDNQKCAGSLGQQNRFLATSGFPAPFKKLEVYGGRIRFEENSRGMKDDNRA